MKKVFVVAVAFAFLLMAAGCAEETKSPTTPGATATATAVPMGSAGYMSLVNFYTTCSSTQTTPPGVWTMENDSALGGLSTVDNYGITSLSVGGCALGMTVTVNTQLLNIGPYSAEPIATYTVPPGPPLPPPSTLYYGYAAMVWTASASGGIDVSSLANYMSFNMGVGLNTTHVRVVMINVAGQYCFNINPIVMNNDGYLNYTTLYTDGSGSNYFVVPLGATYSVIDVLNKLKKVALGITYDTVALGDTITLDLFLQGIDFGAN